MEYRRLGRSDLRISVVGIGCWAMGGTFWGPVDDAESVDAIRWAVDNGINFVDTAPVYGDGHSEEVVGKALIGRREKAIIATKSGLRGSFEEKYSPCGKKDFILNQCDESLKRLGVDRIDLYQVHAPDKDTPFAETMEAMNILKEQGKIRSIGISNFNAEQIREASQHAQIDSLQPPYSMLRRDIEAEILPTCRELEIGLVVYGPLAKGLLTGKFSADSEFREDDLRSSDSTFSGEQFKNNLAYVEKLKSAAKDMGRTPAQLAVRWVIEQEGVTCAICGAKRASQIQESAGAVGWPWNPSAIPTPPE